jgi:hypothetical protein
MIRPSQRDSPAEGRGRGVMPRPRLVRDQSMPAPRIGTRAIGSTEAGAVAVNLLAQEPGHAHVTTVLRVTRLPCARFLGGSRGVGRRGPDLASPHSGGILHGRPARPHRRPERTGSLSLLQPLRPARLPHGAGARPPPGVDRAASTRPAHQQWSADEVVRRWRRLCPRSVLIHAGVPLKRGTAAGGASRRRDREGGEVSPGASKPATRGHFTTSHGSRS